LVEGRQGNDIIDLSAGGQATLLFGNLGDNNTGNNGRDTVTGFTLGSLLSNPHADVIDLSGLLSGATVGTASQFVSIVQNGANAQLWVDRDGSGSAYSSALLLTLNATTVDLSTLLNNQQLVLG
jgi:serralysin